VALRQRPGTDDSLRVAARAGTRRAEERKSGRAEEQ
jgi:hypothetical protein